jgi:hypothetical protein
MPGLLHWSQQLEHFPAKWNPVTPAIGLVNAGRDESRCYRDLLGQSAELWLRYWQSSNEQTRPRRTPPRQNGVIGSKHGDVLIRTLRKTYG